MTKQEAIKLLADTEAFIRRICAEYNTTNDKPKYRPFRGPAECWDEMLKHEPFGWIKYKNKTAYPVVLTCADDTTYFHNLFENYTFADGTPFGIKED